MAELDKQLINVHYLNEKLFFIHLLLEIPPEVKAVMKPAICSPLILFGVLKLYKTLIEFKMFPYVFALSVFVSIFLFIGLFIFIFNCFLAFIFMSKNKLAPSDFLIITGLIGDGVYGLVFASFPFSYVFSLYLLENTESYLAEALPVLWLILDSSSTLFSLMMIFIMSVNRYFAVTKPFKYKIYFRKRNVLMMISFVIIVTTVFLSVGLISLAFPEKKVRWLGLKYGECYPPEDYESEPQCFWDVVYYYGIREYIKFYYLFLWPQIQLVAVVVDSILMIYVYIGIAISYEMKFGSCFKKKKTNLTSSADALQGQELTSPHKSNDNF